MELGFYGLIAGILAGFFGIGGGMIVVPLLLYSNFTIKDAISLSIIQMTFGSLFGSFLNFKKNKKIIHIGIYLGIGGFLGGFVSGFVVDFFNEIFLKYIFLSLVCFAIFKVYFLAIEDTQFAREDVNIYKLLGVGFVVGILSMSAGIGGSIILTPLLATYLKFDLKIASSLGLLFVAFSSSAGFLSLLINGNMLFLEGSILGLFSLMGVYLGSSMKKVIKLKSFQIYLLCLYILVFFSMIFKLFIV